MPATITSYTSFVAGTKAKAEEINRNFSNHRGTLLPISEDSASAKDEMFNIGSTDYRFVNAFYRTWQFRSTSTFGVGSLSKAYQDSSGNFVIDIPDAKEYQFKMNGVDKFIMTDTGTSTKYIKTRFYGETGGSIVMNGATTTFSGFTVPSNFDNTNSSVLLLLDRDTGFGYSLLQIKNGRYAINIMEQANTLASFWVGSRTSASDEITYNPSFSHLLNPAGTVSAAYWLNITLQTGTAGGLSSRMRLKVQELF